MSERMIQTVRQPACSNVVLTEADGTKRRLYQHTHERCRGYVAGYNDGSNPPAWVGPDMRCGPGDCLAQTWERDLFAV